MKSIIVLFSVVVSIVGIAQDTVKIENLGTPISTKEFDFAPIILSNDSKIIFSQRAPRDPEIRIHLEDSADFSLDRLPVISLNNITPDTLWIAFEDRSFCCMNLHLRFPDGGGFIIPYNHEFFVQPTRDNIVLQLLPGDSLVFKAATNNNYSWTDEKRVYWYEHKWFPVKLEEHDWAEPNLITDQTDSTDYNKDEDESITTDELFYKVPARGKPFIVAEVVNYPKEDYPDSPWVGIIVSREVPVNYKE